MFGWRLQLLTVQCSYKLLQLTETLCVETDYYKRDAHSTCSHTWDSFITPVSSIGIASSRRTALKILGVTITNGLSVAEHIQGVITSCSQTLHALRVLRAHGMPPSALHEVFRAVVITKLCYASSAWWGFSTAGDIQRITAFIRRSIRQGYCNAPCRHHEYYKYQMTPSSAKFLPTQITS